MNNEIYVLKQTELLGQQFAVYGSVDEPLFKAQDIVKMLGLTNSRDLVSRIDEDERRKFNLHRQGETWMLTEAGLYEALMQSRKPIARKFKKGVKEILSEIRRTGGYIATTSTMTDDEIMARAINIAQDTIRKRDERIKQLEDEKHNLIEENTVMLPKVRAYEQVINTPQTQWLKTTQEVANEIGMSAQRLNAQLVAMQIIYKASNGEYLVTSNYANWGLHSIVSYPISDTRVKTYIKWTDRGRLYIRALHETNWNKRRAWHLIKNGKEVAEV